MIAQSPPALAAGRILSLAVAALFLCFATPLAAEEVGLERWPEGGHIRVLDPAALSPDEAEKIYQALKPRMISGYMRSGLPDLDYDGWQRFNKWPYLSAQHGSRFVNVVGNALAADLLRASRTNPLPVGAKVLKDSISVVQSGGVSRGPLFIMEKMAAGFDPENGDWRYTMIMPNGKLFGTTKGEGGAAIGFCAECHASAADRDYLFTAPEDLHTVD
jgi:hypothetical protein